MEAVTFLNKEGLKLFGILHKPPKNNQNGKAIIILSPGIKSRVAPYRMYLMMSEAYVELGYTVLRFDFYGLGDSQGEVEEHFTANLYASIQVGRYIGDTISAMDYMQEKFSFSEFTLAGLCGGAITALHSALKDDRIKSIISLGIPVILDGTDIDRYNYITESELKGVRARYLRRSLNAGAWLRFLTFRSDYRIIIKSIFKPVISKIKNSIHINGEPEKEEKQALKDNTNPYFHDIFFNFTKNKKMLLVFSESDRLYYEFQEKFIARHKEKYNNSLHNVQLHVIKDANHIMTFPEWQREMLDITSNWLSKN